jgi:hypothetical protein
MKIVKIKDPIFRAETLLTYGTMEEMAAWYKKHDCDSDINPHYAGFAERLTLNGDQLYHMHFTDYAFSTIVHETHHISLYILCDRGLPLSEECREVHAYYQDWLASKTRDYFEKWANPLSTTEERSV